MHIMTSGSPPNATSGTGGAASAAVTMAQYLAVAK